DKLNSDCVKVENENLNEDKNTTEESLKNYINIFAEVEQIVTKDTKDRNYSSFHESKLNDTFFATEKRQDFRYRKIDNVTRNETEISENIAACSNKNNEKSTTGRASSNTSETRPLAPVPGTPNQSNFRAKIANMETDETSDVLNTSIDN
ncbi:unnamed protein product, partial [Brachionus calyciflorus]